MNEGDAFEDESKIFQQKWTILLGRRTAVQPYSRTAVQPFSRSEKRINCDENLSDDNMSKDIIFTRIFIKTVCL